MYIDEYGLVYKERYSDTCHESIQDMLVQMWSAMWNSNEIRQRSSFQVQEYGDQLLLGRVYFDLSMKRVILELLTEFPRNTKDVNSLLDIGSTVSLPNLIDEFEIRFSSV